MRPIRSVEEFIAQPGMGNRMDCAAGKTGRTMSRLYWGTNLKANPPDGASFRSPAMLNRRAAFLWQRQVMEFNGR